MSNTLVVQNNNTGVDVKRISSREVAEMMEMTHGHLLRKVDDISKVLANQDWITKYWIESTFENRGKQYRGKTYVRYTEKGMQEIIKILSRSSNQEQIKLF